MEQELLEEYKSCFEKVSKPETSEEWEEYNRLYPIITKIKELEALDGKISQADEIIESEKNTDLLDFAREDLEKLKIQKKTISEEIEPLLRQAQEGKSDTDERNAILEIRAGAGGDEASLFAGDLFRMYTQYAQTNGFEIEILDRALTESGGIKEVIARITGKGAFGRYKHESGVHRVQRVPVTESSGRIHTSTASVAVLPEAQPLDLDIAPEDLRIDVFRASGAGGQHVNKTESAIRITHIPTGLIVKCQKERTQIQNRETAMGILRSRLLQMKMDEEQAKQDKIRKGQIGKGMRAEKIRTYNYPQNRITDHRIKVSWHNIDSVMNGNLDELFDALRNAEENTTEK